MLYPEFSLAQGHYCAAFKPARVLAKLPGRNRVHILLALQCDRHYSIASSMHSYIDRQPCPEGVTLNSIGTVKRVHDA